VTPADQRRVLRNLGCGLGQGFRFGRPSSAVLVGPRLAAAGQGAVAPQLAAV
jgi:EAL domain-containing protein (putative c-di-GMP-specific phosphodiesterase class I)